MENINLDTVLHSILVTDGRLLSPDDLMQRVQSGKPFPGQAADWCLCGTSSDALYRDLCTDRLFEMTLTPVDRGVLGNHLIISMDTSHAHHAFVVPMFDPHCRAWASTVASRGIQFSVGMKDNDSSIVFRGNAPDEAEEMVGKLFQKVDEIDVSALRESLPLLAIHAAAFTPDGMRSRNERELIRSITLVAPHLIFDVERVGSMQDMLH
ncbi:hypothetical protein [Paraburkholderia adhaesiva]|uniref:hypothetical protein n=1 Tax=Paraburkholderia adhaesiva TaxID=2883244 RepID=UPI001F221ED3|nr:hypothetical protein [Paraburkholderia adhaesiva]